MNKTSFLNDYIRKSKSSGCTRCSEKSIECLDYHHIHDKRELSFCDLVKVLVKSKKDLKYMIDIIDDEISKCIILCSNCHRKEHHRNKIKYNKKPSGRPVITINWVVVDELLHQGYNYKEIANQLSISYPTMIRKKKHLNIFKTNI